MKRRSVILGFFAVTLLVVWSFFPRLQRTIEITREASFDVPPPTGLSFSSSRSVQSSSSFPSFSSSLNWAVPFTSQAPLFVWDELHEEACEEASVLMVLRFFSGEPIGTPEEAEAAIRALVRRNEELGFAVDDTAEEVRTLILDRDPSLTVELLNDPTETQIKERLIAGSLVIVPAQGQELKNPYFTPPGPRYHMLVLRGFTRNGGVITNDPGTKRGEAYVYPWERILSANHDWNGGDVETGEKVMIVVSR